MAQGVWVDVEALALVEFSERKFMDGWCFGRPPCGGFSTILIFGRGTGSVPAVEAPEAITLLDVGTGVLTLYDRDQPVLQDI